MVEIPIVVEEDSVVVEEVGVDVARALVGYQSLVHGISTQSVIFTACWTHAFVLIPPPLYFCKDSSLYSFSLKTFIGLNTLHYRVPLSGIGGSKHEDFARVCANYSLTISVIFYI